MRSMSDKAYDASSIRNCAIIAHVDHGKTTLMDKLLAYCGTTDLDERAMDSNDHERERGITISSKYTRLYYKDHTLHIVDTPGHADFGGEVERIMTMVDGVILLVDASEGPMSQTKFVLSKAIAAGKKAIVVLNKIDRTPNRAEEVEGEIFDLFCALTDDDDILEYPRLYASAKQGWVSSDLDQLPGKDVAELLDLIVDHFPAPCEQSKADEPFGLSVNTLTKDNHLGRIVTGKVEAGRIKVGDKIKVLSLDGGQLGAETKVTKLFFMEGMTQVPVKMANAGEIVSLAGCDAGVAETVAAIERTEALAALPISPPVISMTVGPNDSPLAGRDGKKLTSSLIKERLIKEVENNVTLSLLPSSDPESLDVQGRGELQIGILLETMRREGYEMTVSPPQVLGKMNEDGVYEEPIEEVTVDVDTTLQGTIIEAMSNRKGEMTGYRDIGDRSRLTFTVPSRGLMGFRHEAMSSTRGSAVVSSAFSHFDKVNPADFRGLTKGKMVSMATGKTTGYSLMSAEQRGQLFVGQGEEVYAGMVIGENAKQGELPVNPTTAKKLSNVRTTGAEEKVQLTPHRSMNIEEIISYMDGDEVLEVTPLNVRLRKRILDEGARRRAVKSNKS
jgi:GTP-binding protein